jgi:hypothetical protein
MFEQYLKNLERLFLQLDFHALLAQLSTLRSSSKALNRPLPTMWQFL